MSRARRTDERTAVELVEEALALLRRTPSALAWHWLGAVPFWLGLLWYFTDMTHGALARQRCSFGALVVAVLYLWKRAAQSRAGAWLRAAAVDAVPPPWGWRDWRVILGLHARCSTWSLLAAGPAALAVAPFGWWLAWHESLATVCDRPSHDATDAVRRAWAAARTDPGQNHLAIGIFSIAAPMAAINIAIVLALLPELARALFGVQWNLALDDTWMLRGSFALIVVAATHLVLDPALKAMYAVRAFHVEARRTGADLRAEWRRCRAAALVLMLPAAVVAAPAARAGLPPPTPPAAVAAEQFNAAADRVLARPEFAWRLPRDAEPAGADSATVLDLALRWFGRQVATIGRAVRRLLDHIETWLRSREIEPSDLAEHSHRTDWVRPTAWAVAAAAALVLVTGILRAARRRAPPPSATNEAAATAALDAETTLATSRPSDEWMLLALERAAAGDHRRAVRALFLAMLAHLAAAGWIEVRPSRTNRDYCIELARRAAAPESIRRRFAHWVNVFERCWYGTHMVDRHTLDEMLAELELWHDSAA